MSEDTKEEADRRKAVADANAAETAAKKAQREEAEAASPSAIAQRAAKADAEMAKLKADSFASFVPDFTKVTRGDLTTATGGEPTAGTGVAGRAIDNAAAHIAAEVVRELGADDWSVLVTDDVDLASSDAVYQDVRYAIGRLCGLATEAIEAIDAIDATKPPIERDRTSLLGVLPLIPAAPKAIAAVASALPGVLSLLSRPRTVTTGTITVSDTAAAMAVAGKLKGNNDKRRVLHDRFRLPPEGGDVQSSIQLLHRLREQLAMRKVALSLVTPSDQQVLTNDLAASLAILAKVIGSIDAYLESITTAPAGAARSPLATAILRQELHGTTPVPVLLVKAESASGMQTIENRLIRDDKFAVIAAATITWSLLNPGGDIRAAGLATGTAQATGKIGERFEIDRT